MAKNVGKLSSWLVLSEDGYGLHPYKLWRVMLDRLGDAQSWCGGLVKWVFSSNVLLVAWRRRWFLPSLFWWEIRCSGLKEGAWVGAEYSEETPDCVGGYWGTSTESWARRCHDEGVGSFEASYQCVWEVIEGLLWFECVNSIGSQQRAVFSKDWASLLGI